MAADSLGSKLKAERESRGFTLDDVSASTKIPVALLEALERDDLSRWPKGLYRRAFFRSYVTAVGLRPEPLAGEFARLFPDDSSLEPPPAVFAATSPHANSPNEPLALPSERWAAERVWHSVAVALVEVAAVLAAGGLVGWAAGMTLLTASGAIALIYYPFVRAAAGRVRRRPNVTRLLPASTPPRAPIPSADAGEVAYAKVRDGVPRPMRSEVATARVPLPPLHAHSGREWLPLAKRITRPANDRLSRAATRTRRALRHGAAATFQASSRFVTGSNLLLSRAATRTGRVLRHGAETTLQVFSRFVTGSSLLLRRAGTGTVRVLRRGAEATFQVSSRCVTWTSRFLRRGGTRTGRVLRHGAEATFQVSSRCVTTSSLLLSRAGARTGRALRHSAGTTFQVSSRCVTASSLLLSRAGTRTGRVLRHGAEATFQVSSRCVTATSLLLRRAGNGSRRALQAAATHTSRVVFRLLRAVNRAFWTGVRAAAEHAELFAARRLHDRKSE